MSAQTTSHSSEFQALITQVETALAQAAVDARELAERTGTPLVVREVRENQVETVRQPTPPSSQDTL